jgi:vesicle-associated membrane protein 7
VKEVQQEVDATRAVMAQAIGQQLANHEKAEVLVDKTDKLAEDASQFKRQAHALERVMWWKNVKLLAAIIGVVLLVIIVIVIILAVTLSKKKT